MSTAEHRKLSGLIVFLLSLCACTYVMTPPPQPEVDLPIASASPALQGQSARITLLQTRQALATALMKRADLAAALIQWKILHVLDPGNVEFDQQLKATTKLIQQRVNIHMQLGEQAFMQGDFTQALREFLRVLALDPQQSRPQTYLRQIANLSLSRLNHRLPQAQAYQEVMQGATEFHEHIADTFSP